MEIRRFTRKDNAKTKLTKCFEEDTDFIILLSLQDLSMGGKTNEKIMLKMSTFKGFCILANTDNGKQIRKYFIKMEEIVQEYLIDKMKDDVENMKKITKSETLMEIYNKKSILYLGLVKKMLNYYIYKYGETWDIKSSLKRHKDTYGEEFHYVYAIECNRKNDLEKIIKNHTLLIDKHVKEYEGRERYELLRIDSELTLNKLISIIEASKQVLDAQNTLQIEEKEIDNKLEMEKYNFQLGMEKEKTLQIKEKTRQMEIELEMIKIKNNETILSSTTKTPYEANNLQTETIDLQNETSDTQNEVNDEVNVIHNEINDTQDEIIADVQINEITNTVTNTVTDPEIQELANYICEIFKHSPLLMCNKDIYDAIYKEIKRNNDMQLLVKLKQTCGPNPEKIKNVTRGYGMDFVKSIQKTFICLGLKKKDSKALGQKTGYYVCKK